MDKKALKEKLYASQDGGGREKRKHPITKVIDWALADDTEQEVESNLQYAISELRKALNALR